MRDIFICPRNNLLVNWAQACPEAKIYPSFAAIDFSRRDDCLFWLHTDTGSQQWMVATISQILRDFFRLRRDG